MNRRRKKVPKHIETEILLRGKRRCPLCFGLDGDVREVRGQIAHLDRNPQNNDPKNLAYLCQRHHDDYDSPRRQTKSYTAHEVRKYQDHLVEYLAKNPLGTGLPARAKTSEKSPIPIASPDLYERRMAVYRRTREFLGKVVGDAACSLQDALSFAQDTHEAQFLFDDRFAKYLHEIYQRALRIHTYQGELEGISPGSKRDELVEREHRTLLWLYDQGTELTKKARPFLRLS